MTTPGPLTLEDLERLRVLSEAATPGPWEAYEEDGEAYVTGGPHGSLILIAGNRAYPHPQDLLNLRYLAVLDPSTVLRLLAALRSLQADLDETHADLAHRSEQVRSLTVERDGWERVSEDHVLVVADLRARLSRAREALGSFDENPPPYRAGHLVEGEWRIHQARALAALRAALAEPPS